jgi:hypothetical protein
MTRVRTLFFLTCLMVSWRCALVAQSLDSSQSDIDMVRATYAKLIFASRLNEIRVGVLEKSEDDIEEVLLRSHLEVVLSDIKTGPVSDLMSVPLANLVTKPSGATLAVTPGPWTFQTTDGERLQGETASLKWKDSGHLAQDWNLPFSRLFELGAVDPGFTRYASFTARVSYSGQARQYQALFLFGRDASGQPITLPLDHIVGASVLQMLIQAPNTPDPLLAQPFRNRPESRDLINSMRAAPGCSPESRTQMCCSQSTGRCGVTDEILQEHGFTERGARSLDVHPATAPACPYCAYYNYYGAPDPQTDGPQTQGHITGAHQGNATFTPSCTYNLVQGACVPTCHVNWSGQPTESGILYAQILSYWYCHAETSNSNSMDFQGAGGTCSSSWGYGVSLCLFCFCPFSVSVSLPPVSVSTTSSSSVWTWGQGLSSTCKVAGQ